MTLWRETDAFPADDWGSCRVCGEPLTFDGGNIADGVEWGEAKCENGHIWPAGRRSDGGAASKPFAANRRLSVEVKATEMDVFKQAVALLADAYEALASARSEGWDMLSGPTREEVCGVMDAIQEFGT